LGVFRHGCCLVRHDRVDRCHASRHVENLGHRCVFHFDGPSFRWSVDSIYERVLIPGVTPIGSRQSGSG
jgi:hypothetical protein